LPDIPNPFQVHQILTLDINGLSATGDGLGQVDADHPVVFVANTVPGDRIRAKLTQVKPRYAHAQLVEVLTPSPNRVRPACIVADKCGGCQWLAVDYPTQLVHKQDAVLQALQRIGKLDHPPLDPILGVDPPMAYRNKVTYPLGVSIHQGERRVKAGYYQKGSHRLINLNQCPVQDERLNPLLAEIKQDIQAQGWSIYDEANHRGSLRHLGLRIGRRTGEILITLVSSKPHISGLVEQAQVWMDRWPAVVGVCLNVNGDRTNRIFGDETHFLGGRDHLIELCGGLRFQIHPTTFFQIHTEQVEAVITLLQQSLNLQGTETVMDAYCGIGTLSLPLAEQVQRVIGLEVHTESVRQARMNAALNQITNAEFLDGAVETLLAQVQTPPNIVLLDPPRRGCDPSVLEQLLRLMPEQIVYMSCNPATLARDLQQLCGTGQYEITRVQPADFFPQTSHVETLAFLSKRQPL
jgi:23S rRNA (uracil1939-C5)-methyltransferase